MIDWRTDDDGLIAMIESGEYLKFCEPNIRSKVKRYLILTKGHRCSICRSTKWMSELIPLVCDHIDGNSENNLLNNYRLVCPNCDAQLPTYKSKNKGQGRGYDKQYMNKRNNGELG